MIGQLGSVILVIALLSLRQIVITHISIALAHCDQDKNTIDKLLYMYYMQLICMVPNQEYLINHQMLSCNILS